MWNAKRKFKCIHRPGHIHDYAFAWAHDQTFFLRFWKLLYLRLHLRNITNCITSAYWIIDLQKIWLPRTAKQWSELRPAHNWRHNLYHSWILKNMVMWYFHFDFDYLRQRWRSPCLACFVWCVAGLETDGIYRVSGNLAVIQKLRFLVNHGKDAGGGWETTDDNCSVITGGEIWRNLGEDQSWPVFFFLFSRNDLFQSLKIKTKFISWCFVSECVT